jgi:hypothetical protein
MNIRRVLVALAVAGGLLVAGAAPALAAGPPVPAGCTFDQSDGVLTCVTTTTGSGVIGPFNTNGQVPDYITFDGFTGAQICGAIGVNGAAQDNFTNLTVEAIVTTTTTTERHGLNGRVFYTSASITPLSLVQNGYVGGSYDCIP